MSVRNNDGLPCGSVVNACWSWNGHDPQAKLLITWSELANDLLVRYERLICFGSHEAREGFCNRLPTMASLEQAINDGELEAIIMEHLL